MASTSAFRQAYRAERAPRASKPRTPLLVYLGRLLGKLLPSWDALRSFVLSLAGLAAVCAGAFQISEPVGWIAAGLSLLVMEFLVGGDR